MSWARFDDQVTFHPKIVDAGNAAVGLWVRMTTYACAQLTDGFIPATVALLLGSKEEIDKAADCGLLDVVKGGYQVHDFLHHNPSSEQARATRATAAAAKREAGRIGGKQSGAARRSRDEAETKQPASNNEAEVKQSASSTIEADPKQTVEAERSPVPSRPVRSEEKTNSAPARVMDPAPHPDYGWFHGQWCKASGALISDAAGTKLVFGLILEYAIVAKRPVCATCDDALAAYAKVVAKWDTPLWSSGLFNKHWETVQGFMVGGKRTKSSLLDRTAGDT